MALSDVATTFRSTIPSALGQGVPAVRVAVLDGVVDATHRCFIGADLRPLETLASQAAAGNLSADGTYAASLIFGQPRTPVEGVAPRCRGLSVPIFAGGGMRCSELELARAIRLAVKHGAQIIHIGDGAFARCGELHPVLKDALAECIRENILIVTAAGSEGLDLLGTAARAVLVVDALSEDGHPLLPAEPAWRTETVLAPGAHVSGATLQGGVVARSGARSAAPLVSAFAALLLSHQIKLGAQPNPYAVREALLESAVRCTPSGSVRISLQGAIDHVVSAIETEGEAERLLDRVGLASNVLRAARP